MGKEAGQKAEWFFAAELNKRGIPHEFIDGWYDYLVAPGTNKKIKVEVKSCQISIKDNNDRLRVGRFDFTNPDNLARQQQEDAWVCMIVRHREQFIFYGFVKAKQIMDKRYLTLHGARKLKPLDFDEWVMVIS